jgi:hypothetical protein
MEIKVVVMGTCETLNTKEKFMVSYHAYMWILMEVVDGLLKEM